MKPNPHACKGIKAAIKALCSPPMTEDERREYDRLRAREMHRAEAMRRKSPQLDLDE